MLNPLDDVARIEARQRALRHIDASVRNLGARNVGDVLDRVEHYLASPYQELPKKWLGCVSIRWWYPGMVEELVAGLEAVIELLPIAHAIARDLGPCGNYPELEPIVEQIERFISSPAIHALRHVRRTPVRQLSLARLDLRIRRVERAVTEGVVVALHRLDALQSLARAARRPGYSYPTVVESPHPLVSATAAFHPLIEKATSYDIELGPESRVLFLTGPNMAGKTTYLKTCGLLVLMAHIGMAVPASQATLSRFDRLFSVLALRDSTGRGESLFLAEVRRVGR